jgi:hypothetical protein
MLVTAVRREQEHHEIAPVQDELAPSEPILGLDT